MTAIRATTALLMLTVLGGRFPAAAQDAASSYAQTGYDTDGQSVDTIAVFFEPLSHYGRWLDGRYGREWAPSVPRDWRPYTLGHWEEGAYGATWRSDEPFGWAVFHFGRWAFDPPVGWVWLPDTVWGPGWVAWRDGDDVTGWAPLPPQVNLFAGGYGFNDWGYDQWYQPGWVYVPRGYLYARSLRGVALPYTRNRDGWDRTRGVTRYDRSNGQVVNRSFGDSRGPDRRDGRGDLRSTQPAQSARPPLLAGSGDAGGFIPLPHGYGEGFVPGVPPRGFGAGVPPRGFVPGVPPRGFVPGVSPGGFDRRAVPPGAVAGRPMLPPARAAVPPAAAPRPTPSSPRPTGHDARPR